MVDDDEKVMKKFRFSGVTYIKVDVSQGLTYRKGDVNELPDPGAYNHPPVNELPGWWNIGGTVG